MTQTSLSNLPGHRPAQRQLLLFETRALTYGSCRNYAGDFMEEATANLSGGDRLKTSSKCEVCPDVALTDHDFLEVKSVGRTDEAIVYETRLDRDRKFVDYVNDFRELYYLFWCHRFRVGKAETLPELHQGLASHLHSVVIVRFHVLYLWLKTKPIKLLNRAYYDKHKKTGWGCKGYGYGWNVPMRKLRGECNGTLIVPRLRVYDTSMQNIYVHFHQSVPRSLRELLHDHELTRQALDIADPLSTV